MIFGLCHPPAGTQIRTEVSGAWAPPLPPGTLRSRPLPPVTEGLRVPFVGQGQVWMRAKEWAWMRGGRRNATFPCEDKRDAARPLPRLAPLFAWQDAPGTCLNRGRSESHFSPFTADIHVLYPRASGVSISVYANGNSLWDFSPVSAPSAVRLGTVQVTGPALFPAGAHSACQPASSWLGDPDEAPQAHPQCWQGWHLSPGSGAGLMLGPARAVFPTSRLPSSSPTRFMGIG